MKKDNITKFELDPHQLPQMNAEQLARLDAMTEEEVHAAALSDPDNLPLTDEDLAQFERVLHPKTMRDRRPLTESDFSRIQALVQRPGESLTIEIKRWIDPDQLQGKVILVRAALALRNYGGGYIVIGFDNDTLEPDRNNVPPDVRGLFHIDKIQGLISHYASEPFEVVVEFPERDGQLYPVIVVPPGVKTPVAVKSDLRVGNDPPLLRADSVYIRSLNANNTPSSTIATWKDWPKIVEVCFDNREADIGRFLRRHLGSLTPEVAREFFATILRGNAPEITTEERLQKYLQEGEERFQAVATERGATLPKHGAWEVALLFIGQIPQHAANREFLSLLAASNPQYTGWPVWLDSSGFTEQSARPCPFHGVWEAFINDLVAGWRAIDFMRFDPKGRFYLRRALQEDVVGGPQAPAPMTALDFDLPIICTAEAIAAGIAFAKAMGCDAEKTLLAFAFRWTKLQGRKLTSVGKERHIFRVPVAYQDEVLAFVNVPLDTPLSALGSFVNQAVQPLFEVFDGFGLSSDVVEELTRRLIERRL